MGRVQAQRHRARRSPTTTTRSPRTVWENRDNLPYAWRILRKGVCDGCALGVAGFHDWTISGVHLCTTRLNLLRVNTMGALDPRGARRRRRRCGRSSGKELRDLGRLAVPDGAAQGRAGLHAGSPGTRRSTSSPTASARRTPDRLAVYLTARGITNEVYYVAQKVTRFLGTNNIDNAARVCHAPSTTALKQDDRRRRDHVLLHRRHRQRPHRAVRRQRRQRAAGVHEVPVPGAQARREGRGGEPAARAGARALLGAEQRRERDVRHAR